jgi:hypothetical protein
MVEVSCVSSESKEQAYSFWYSHTNSLPTPLLHWSHILHHPDLAPALVSPKLAMFLNLAVILGMARTGQDAPLGPLADEGLLARFVWGRLKGEGDGVWVHWGLRTIKTSSYLIRLSSSSDILDS